MKILGVIGSSRTGSNTECLVREALEGAKEAGAQVEALNLAGMNIAPCNGCEFCDGTGECSIDDDMQQVYDRLLEADGILVGSPVYFWSVSGQVKVFMDRTYSLLKQRKLRGKVGGVVVVARRAGCTNAYSLLNSFFAIQRMTMAGGAIAYADKEGGVRNDKQGMAEARAAGRAMARAIQRLGIVTK